MDMNGCFMKNIGICLANGCSDSDFHGFPKVS